MSDLSLAEAGPGELPFAEAIPADASHPFHIRSDQFELQDRLDALERLARSVRRELGPLVATAQGEATGLRQHLVEGDPLLDIVSSLERTCGRAQEVLLELGDFAGATLGHPELLDLNDLVLDLESALITIVGPDIRLHLDLQAEPALVRVDTDTLIDSVFELARNAAAAMPDGGQLTFQTRHERGDRENGVVRLDVIDTGIGMDPLTLARAREPFFTTRPGARGLGLSRLHGCLAVAGGELVLSSHPAQGSRVGLRLPAVGTAVERQRRERSWHRPLARSETILLVEDDAMIRLTARRMLARQGYQVITAGDAAEAEARALAHRGTIDLLVADLSLPGATGLEIATSLRWRRPELAILFIGGGPAEVVQLPETGDLPRCCASPSAVPRWARPSRAPSDDAPPRPARRPSTWGATWRWPGGCAPASTRAPGTSPGGPTWQPLRRLAPPPPHPGVCRPARAGPRARTGRPSPARAAARRPAGRAHQQPAHPGPHAGDGRAGRCDHPAPGVRKAHLREVLEERSTTR